MAKARINSIPKETKEQVEQIVEDYNAKNETQYMIHFKGAFCYFLRLDTLTIRRPGLFGRFLPKEDVERETVVGRLKWTGDMNDWTLAIYLYSKETYTTEYWGFPNSGGFDGTVKSLLECNLYA